MRELEKRVQELEGKLRLQEACTEAATSQMLDLQQDCIVQRKRADRFDAILSELRDSIPNATSLSEREARIKLVLDGVDLRLMQELTELGAEASSHANDAAHARESNRKLRKLLVRAFGHLHGDTEPTREQVDTLLRDIRLELGLCATTLTGGCRCDHPLTEHNEDGPERGHTNHNVYCDQCACADYTEPTKENT
jgi:hypothetical protein